MRSSSARLLAAAALAAPLGLCLVGLAIRLADWPERWAEREVAAAGTYVRKSEATWQRLTERWREDADLTVLRRGDPAPFARWTAEERAVDPRAAILGELVAGRRFEAALEFREVMSRDREETPAMRWAVARAEAGLGRTAVALGQATALLDELEARRAVEVRVDGLPLAGMVAPWAIRWAVSEGQTEAARALVARVVDGRAPVPAFAAEGLMAEWQDAGIAPPRFRGASWRCAAARLAESGGVLPEPWTRTDRALWVPRDDGGLAVVPPRMWWEGIAVLARPKPGGLYLESDEHPRRLATLELPGGFRFAVRHLGRRDSVLLDGLSWILILVGGLGTLGGGLLLWRTARREVALLRMRQAFVDQVSHDLRTPLTALMVKTELLATGQLPEHKVAGYQRSVHRETTRLAEVVHSVLDFARLERAGVPIPLGAVPVRAVLAEAFRGARELLGAQDCRVSFDVARGLPALAANRPLLVRALRNLLENAAQHAPCSEVSVTARPLDDRRLELVVADRGPGLGVKDPAVLFEAGRRGPVGEQAGGGGHGLGLSVVAQAIAAHGGSVTAADREGGGAEFRMVLPIDAEAA